MLRFVNVVCLNDSSLVVLSCRLYDSVSMMSVVVCVR